MLVQSSFKVVLQQMPQTDSVDDIDVPVGVIYLPPSLQPVASAAVGDDALNAADAASDPSLDSDAALASSAEEEEDSFCTCTSVRPTRCTRPCTRTPS